MYLVGNVLKISGKNIVCKGLYFTVLFYFLFVSHITMPFTHIMYL